jgi:hypothetical protein
MCRQLRRNGASTSLGLRQREKRRRKTEEGARRGFCGGEEKDVGLEGGRAVNKDASEVKPSQNNSMGSLDGWMDGWILDVLQKKRAEQSL